MAGDSKYVTRLMKMRCSMGTMENYINCERDHGVLAGAEQQPVLNANDHTEKNIIHFGSCISDKNPERMFRKGLVGILLGPAEQLTGGAVTGLLETAGIMSCKCKPNTPTPWIFVNEDNILEGAPALTIDSKCACRYGGVIEFVDTDNPVVIDEFESLHKVLMRTIQTEPWNFEKIKHIIGQMANTSKGEEIEEKAFSAIAGIVSPLLAFEYNKDKDYYYTNETKGAQRRAGFMDLYDHLGILLGMDLDTEIVTFTPEGSNKEYRLQFWKGSYGYGFAYGGEIGLYSRDLAWAKLNPYEQSGGINDWFDLYACVSGEDEIRTVQTIYDANTGLPLLKNDTGDYAEGGDHFWNLAIQSKYGYSKDDLMVIEKLYVSDPKMLAAMENAMKENKNLKILELGEENGEQYIAVQYGEMKGR